MCPMRRKTPTAGLEVLFDIPPVDLVVKEAALKSFLRVDTHHNTKWDGLGNNGSYGHLRWCKGDIDKLGINPDGYDKTMYLNLNRKYKIDLESKESGLPITDCSTQCYTNGSRLDERSGYGLYITQEQSEATKCNGFLGRNATVFQSEIYAIQKASEILRNMNTTSVTIFTDSQAALSVLAKVQIKSKVVKNCITELNKLGKSKVVDVKWIRSHSDFVGNEEADAQAKAGTKRENEEKIPSPFRMALREIEEAIEKTWNTRWKNSPEYRQTKQWFPIIDKAKSKRLIKQDRTSLSYIVQLVTGHNRLRYQEYIINKETSPFCRRGCKVNETSYHIVTECPAFWRMRAEVFKIHHTIEGSIEWSVQQIVKIVKNSQIIALLEGDQEQNGLP